MKFLVVFLVLLMIWKLPLPMLDVQSKGFQFWLTTCRRLPLYQRWWSWLQYLIIVVVPSALVFVVFYQLEPVLWGFPSLILEILLVLYALMHADAYRHVRTYQTKVESGDYQAAFLCAQQHLGLADFTDDDNQPEKVTELVIKSLLYRWFQYFFLVLFWYLIADVAGIVFVWLSLQYAKQSTNPFARSVLFVLEAIPVRLLALTYGLAGNLIHALPVWQRSLRHWQLNHAEFLFEVAKASLTKHEPSIKISSSWFRLYRYSISIWLVIIAIATLGGWML